MDHVMLDLETLGTSAGCAIVSIGAVKFGPQGFGDQFYQAVDLRSDPLGVIDPGTVVWWMKQSNEARAVFEDRTKMGLEQALLKLVSWAANDFKEQRLWCHGATFDAPILEAACKRTKVICPWPFYNVRDTRTLYELAKVEVERSSGHHNALTDAVDQAKAAHTALDRLGWPS